MSDNKGKRMPKDARRKRKNIERLLDNVKGLPQDGGVMPVFVQIGLVYQMLDAIEKENPERAGEMEPFWDQLKIAIEAYQRGNLSSAGKTIGEALEKLMQLQEEQ